MPPKTDIFVARLDPTTKRLKHLNTVIGVGGAGVSRRILPEDSPSVIQHQSLPKNMLYMDGYIGLLGITINNKFSPLPPNRMVRGVGGSADQPPW